MAVIWWASARTTLPGAGRGPAWTFGWNLAHAPTFGLLALLLLPLAPRADGWVRLGPRQWAWLSLVAVGYGVVDEWHQAHVPGRHPSFLDVVTDAVGVGCVLWIATYLGRPAVAEGGLRRRLAAGLGLCLTVAASATFLLDCE